MNQVQPVTIITGYLGAGKTTFLNQLLRSCSEKRFAVIENEFGKEQIDADLLIRTDIDLIGITNGCICCTSNGDLDEALFQLTKKADLWDELLIECTGVANPEGVIFSLVADPILARTFPVKRVIGILDAENYDQTSALQPIINRQLAQSDVILISKAEKIEDPVTFRSEVAAMFPLSVVEILSNDSSLFNKILRVTRTQDFHINPSIENHHTKGIKSISFSFQESFDLVQLRHRFIQLMMFQSSNIYRIKGIFSINGEDHRFVLQSVANNVSISKGSLWSEGEQKISKIVFIGENLERDGLAKMMQQLFTK